MAQTTWVIEGQEIEQQVQGGKEFKDVLAQLIPASTSAARDAPTTE
jgi:iron complex outermembrane receptor protein